MPIELVVGLLVLAGVVITAAGGYAGALIAGRARTDDAAAKERAAFLQTVEENVEGLRRRAVTYEERLDALGLALEQSRRDNLECIRERNRLQGELAGLHERVTRLEGAQGE